MALNTRLRSAEGDDQKPKWTVMVFMGADSPPGAGARDLGSEARADIAEMGKVAEAAKAASTETLNILVQFHHRQKAERIHVGKPDPVEDVPDAERDPRNGQALIHFLEWALRKAKHTDEDHSLLVLWGHAFRFAVGFTDTPTGTDGLDFAELSAVLTRFQQKWVADHPKSDGKLDVVGFDACELATIEMAAQLHPFADYLIASQMGIPIPGWPYDQVLDLLAKPRTPPVTPPDLGAYIVRRFCTDYFKKYGTASLTMLDLEKVPQIVDATEELARSLAVAIDRDQDEMDRVDFIFHQSQTWENKPFVDVADLCLNLWRYCADSNVKAAAEALGDLLIRPFPYSRPVYRDDGTLDTSERPFIIEHGRNSHETARLHGVSLYAPHIATDDGDWINECYHWYRKFDFGTTNTWSALINALAQPG